MNDFLGFVSDSEHKGFSDGKFSLLFKEDKFSLVFSPESEELEPSHALIYSVEEGEASPHLVLMSKKISINAEDLALVFLEVESHADVADKREGTVYTLAGDNTLFVKK